MHPSLNRLSLLVAAIVLAALLVQTRSAFGL